MATLEQLRDFLDDHLERRPDEVLPLMKMVWYDDDFDGFLAVFEFNDKTIQVDADIDGVRFRTLTQASSVRIQPEDAELWIAGVDDNTYIVNLNEHSAVKADVTDES